jgi:4-amino-4-deoxy-L-arabinose transferase-like glycosyltransferase
VLQRLRQKDRFTVALAVIALVGLVWRVVFVLCTQRPFVLGDGYTYHFGAISLVNGFGFSDPKTGLPVAGHPPLWILVLAGPTLLGLKSWLSQQLFTCLIGTATIVMTGVAGRAAFGRRVGIVAAALAAAYPLVWVYERALLAEPLGMLLTATTIWLAFRFRAKPGLGLAIALGAAVGLMAMTTAELIVIAVLLVAPLIMLVRDVERGRRLAWLAAAAVACALVIAPWAIYNSTRFAKPVPFSTGLGSELLQGNCTATYHGRLLCYYVLGCSLFVPNLSHDYSVADAQDRHVAVDFMKANKSRVPIVAAARLGRTFGVFRPTQQMHLEAGESATPLWVFRLGFLLYWIFLPFAAAGIVIARRRRIPVFPFLAFPLMVAISVLPTVGSVRYGAAAEIALILLAAVGIEGAIAGVQRRRLPGNARR